MPSEQLVVKFGSGALPGDSIAPEWFAGAFSPVLYGLWDAPIGQRLSFVMPRLSETLAPLQLEMASPDASSLRKQCRCQWFRRNDAIGHVWTCQLLSELLSNPC